MAKVYLIKEKIQKITLALHGISLGDFSQQLELPEKEDEFSDLIVVIDLMADNLKELIEENQRKTSQVKFSREKIKASNKILKKAKANVEQEKAKAEALLGSLGEGIIAIDLKGNVISINKEAERMFGKKYKEVVGQPYMEIYEFKDIKGHIIRPDGYPISEVITKKRRVYTTTYFICKSNTKFLPLATTVSPIIIGDKVFGIIETFRDITKEQEVNRTKTEFVSLASHQLRTPLTAINWLLQELVRTVKLNKYQQEYIQDAIKSNNRMIRLVNNLLNVSRLETGAISVISKKLDVVNLISQVIGEASSQIKEKRQKIMFVKPKGKVIIEADFQLISQVISNLLSNAVKYSDPLATITIKLTKKVKKVIISVKDQGIGIPKDQQHRMFEKFFRTGEAAKRSTTGSGLGMYIVKKIAESCKGNIKFKSEENKGSEFMLTLPEKGPVKREGIKELIKHEV